MRTPFALFLAFAAAGCVAPAPRVAHAPAPVIMPVPRPEPTLLAADWRNWPATAGSWSYRADGRGSVAMFGRPGADAQAVLRCERDSGHVFLSVAGAAAGAVTVRTSSVARTVPMAPTGGTPAYLAASLAPADPLLDAIAFSRGRFALSLPGTAPLVLPAWAEVGRVVEDCRP